MLIIPVHSPGLAVSSMFHSLQLISGGCFATLCLCRPFRSTAAAGTKSGTSFELNVSGLQCLILGTQPGKFSCDCQNGLCSGVFLVPGAYARWRCCSPQ